VFNIVTKVRAEDKGIVVTQNPRLILSKPVCLAFHA
jgi:hypothetical protein